MRIPAVSLFPKLSKLIFGKKSKGSPQRRSPKEKDRSKRRTAFPINVLFAIKAKEGFQIGHQVR